MEKGMRGLCSESLFSSSLKIGFGLIAGRILLHSQTSQTILDSVACALIKDKKPVFSVCIGFSVMVSTFISIIGAVCVFCRPSRGLLLWWMFWTGVFYLGFVGYGEFGIFQLLDRRGRVHVSGLICLCSILTGNYCLPKIPCAFRDDETLTD